MNDFTKEELSIILLSIAGNAYPELKEKIQSMIDNYCEHKRIITIDCLPPVSRCMSCGERVK